MREIFFVKTNFIKGSMHCISIKEVLKSKYNINEGFKNPKRALKKEKKYMNQQGRCVKDTKASRRLLHPCEHFLVGSSI